MLRRIGQLATRAVHRASQINVFVSPDLKRRYSVPGHTSWVVNESRLPADAIVSTLPQRQPGEPLRLAYLGRLAAEKDIPTLLRACALLDGVTLRLIGAGPQREPLEQLVQELGLQNRVTFHGAVAWGPDLFALLRQHHVLVLPSLTEGLPLVLSEGMSQGLVAVGSRVGGIPDLIEDGRNGLLFTPGRAPELAAQLSRLRDDPALLSRLGMASLETARANTLDKQQLNMFAALARYRAALTRQ
ncbi:glycosyltransferase [Deinococcus lacus]|uniref:Glycosyltransferase n=1 Tax=Deinococcus lacus TaxID=392561 RepID=A0ABW1YHC0_9DEIO